ncbi:hypothetical protein BDW22DRAFT_1401804 [Trametopsis cervina]|nr:hypothetical protein BDW22DRAFT_1401804 [Trametopsis cervina]
MATEPLTLPASLLTRKEHGLYTTGLCALADTEHQPQAGGDSYYESLEVSTVEVRGWLSAILQLFCPSLLRTDVLSGEQFFAAARLATHVRSGTALVEIEHLLSIAADDYLDEAGDTVSELPQAERNQRHALHSVKDAAKPSDTVKSNTIHYQEQAARPIYNGRPFTCIRLPVSILDPTLAQLQDDVEHIDKHPPKAETVAQTAKLVHTLQQQHENENKMMVVTMPLFLQLLGIDPSEAKTNYKLGSPSITASDAAVLFPLADPESFAIALHFEGKLSLTEADVESILTYRKHVAYRDELQGALYATCLPCIHIAIAGPYIRISVTTYGEDIFVYHVTDYISIGGPGDLQHLRRRVDYIARHFDLVRKALQALREYYASIPPRTQEQADGRRFWPNPTRSGGERALADLVYKDRISSEKDATRPRLYMPAMWEATYKGERVLVKFTEHYSVRAHRILADCVPPKAPKLHFAERLLGGVWMVVMEYLEGQDADKKFGHKALPGSVVADVEVVLKLLHDRGMVFGDLQRPNIMVKMEGAKYRAKLIDFDFSGKEIESEGEHTRQVGLLDEEGTGSYDCFLRTDPGFPQGVQPAGRMHKQHDLDMLHIISKADYDIILNQPAGGSGFVNVRT